jgi:hypothetical protein
MKKPSPWRRTVGDLSIRELLRVAVENNAPGAQFELDLHERHLKTQSRKRRAHKKAKKVARASRKKNR